MAASATDGELEAHQLPRLGRYVLTHELASGGMGTVYLGRIDGPRGFGKLVAIKLMHEHLVDSEVGDMFADEARIASRIHHPNVCPIYDFGEQDGLFYLVMELLAGVPLSRVLEELALLYEGRTRPASYFAMVARVMTELLHGLHAVHEISDDEGRPLDVVHRDIAPDNLFVTWDGAVRILDFGIAGGRGRIHRTRAGTFKGKLAYAAPEQFHGRVTRAADIWSAGAVLWEMLTLSDPFWREGGSLPSGGPFACPRSVAPDVPEELGAIARRALSMDPAQRHRTARDMAREVGAYAARHPLVDTVDVSVWVQSLCPGDYERSRDLLARARAIGRASSQRAWDPTVVDRRAPASGDTSPVSGLHTLTAENPDTASPPPPGLDHTATLVTPTSSQPPPPAPPLAAPLPAPPGPPAADPPFLEALDDQSGVRPSEPEPGRPRRGTILFLVLLFLVAGLAILAGAVAAIAI